MKIDGACHCGYITYSATVDPATVAICHCTDCQTLSGSPFRSFVPASAELFELLDWGGVRSLPACPTYDRCCQWVIETLRLSNVETRMGAKLYSAFLAAGLPAPSMRLEAVNGGSEGSSGRVKDLAETILPESLLPAMERLGVTTAAEVGFETLAERMCSEISAARAAIVGRSEIGAWTRA